MIRINYNGTLGNRMWQYCVARLYAQKHGHMLIADPIEMFPNTKEIVSGKGEIGNFRVFREHVFDFGFCDGDRLFDGFFQRYEYLKGHRDTVKRWFHNPHSPKVIPSSNDLVLTIRRGWNNYPTSLCPPVEFYLNIIKTLSPEKVYLCTDTFDDPYFDSLRAMDNVVFYNSSMQEQFSLIMNAHRIVISPSTYSWWGAYLSEATQIIYPLFSDLLPTHHGPNLMVDDDPRYLQVAV